MNKDTVIVSLTTHSIRVAQVAKTAIFSILQNTYKDVHIVLTLYKDDIKLIPNDLQLLIDNGLVELIIAEQDLGPHLKYFYAMQKYRENPVITIDDDVIYPETMIEKLVVNYKKHPECIIARRSFMITGRNGNLDSYHIWLRYFSGIKEPTHSIFATGIGGILYPPNCLDLSDDNVEEILTIKYDDDFYLKALEVRKNLKIVNVCQGWGELYKKNLDDPHTQSIALWNKNSKGRSDACVQKYKKEFLDAIR